MMDIPAEVARRIRVVLLDADGVLTDGGLYVSEGVVGELEGRRFHVHDGLAIHMLRRAGLGVAIVSGKLSGSVKRRAEELGIEEVHQVTAFGKLEAVEGVLQRAGASWIEAAFLGDDLADLPVLREVGLPAAVANAVSEVKEAAAWIGKQTGGNGAVREFIEALLAARGEWSALVEEYVAECVEHWRAETRD
jgi:3-deoxy-D-manno-octulosonate 8-phosphate phosphatase (KDO 8-P phosphatase)